MSTNEKPDFCRMNCRTCKRPLCTGARLIAPPNAKQKRRAVGATPKK